MAEKFITMSLAQVIPLSQTVTGYYTVPTGRKAVVTSIVFCNYTGATVTVGLLAAVWVLYNKTLGPYETYAYQPNIVLKAGDAISLFCSALNSVGVMVSGVEIAPSGVPDTFITKQLGLSGGLPHFAGNNPVYTVPAATKAVLTSVTFTNTATATRYLRLQTAAVPILVQVPLLAIETLTFQLNIVIHAGDVLHAYADPTDGDVHAVFSGVEVT